MPEETVYVVLLRGVNVGGHHKVPMAELRGAAEAAGCRDVASYIQSGNLVLRSAQPAADLAGTLRQVIADRFGFDTAVMVRSADEMADVVGATPYPQAADGTVHVGFLHEPPTPRAAEMLDGIEAAPESLRLRGRELYVHLPTGLGRSKLIVEVGKRFKEPMTVRNWRTVKKLVDMSAEL